MKIKNSLKDILSDQPREQIPFDLSPMEPAIDESVRYLESSDARKSIETNPYWPKWNSPWWHMSTLFEMGMANRIPRLIAELMLSEIKATHLPYFFSEEAPSDKSPMQVSPCPCSFGNIYQIINATGLSFDSEIPWARQWFLKYQMPDGGLNCDKDAYKADPKASSLVGTIAPLEAILSTPARLTAEETRFLDHGAQCLIDRQLRLGSDSQHNAEEKLDEADWLKPSFPRLYFYDVLRGLTFILRWSETLGRALPASAIFSVVQHFCTEFPDGRVQARRRSYEGVGTRLQDASGKWQRGNPATHFTLLDRVSELDQTSPFLTAKWQEAVLTLDRLVEKGLIS